MLDIVEAARSATVPYKSLQGRVVTSRFSDSCTKYKFTLKRENGSKPPKKRPNVSHRVNGLTWRRQVYPYSSNGCSTWCETGGKLAIIAYDPMSPISSGALLGDRLRVDFNTG